jgi:aminoglycoside phosphotransferase (APT) family kinase protein
MIVDLQVLASWMTEQGLGDGPIVDAERIGGGTQNILLQFVQAGRRYVLRRPPEHKRANSDETIRREIRVLGALAETGVPHPQLIAACGDTAVLGAAFYLMEPVTGFNPAQCLPGSYRIDPGWRRDLGFAVVDGAAAVGAVDYVAAGLADLGVADGYLERQVPRWWSQLESYAAFPEYPVSSLPGVSQVASWLEDHRPTSWQPGLIHGDYHLGNVLIGYDRPALASIVDWELATIGDPLLDLGWLLASWPDSATGSPGIFQIEPWDGFPTAEELIARYAARTVRDTTSVNWYHVLACYKLGILLEGTYARALSGLAPMDTGTDLHRKAVQLFRRALAIVA